MRVLFFTRTLKISQIVSFFRAAGLFFFKNRGFRTEQVPENSRCLISEGPCKGGTPTLQTNQFEHNILAVPFFPEPCKTLHRQQPEPAFFARNRGFRKQDRGSLDTWTPKMGRNRRSQPHYPGTALVRERPRTRAPSYTSSLVREQSRPG